MSIRRFLIFVGFVCCLQTRGYSATGSEGASFLDIPVGGRPAALGSAYSAMTEDAYAPFYNPAGLGFLKSTQLAGQHLSYLESIRVEAVSLVHPIKEGTAIGLAGQYLASGDLDALDNTGVPTGTFNVHYGGYTLAAGRRVTERLAVGANVKFVESKISDVSAHAFAADLGVLFRPVHEWNVSAGFANLGSRLKFLEQADALPLRSYVGTSWQPNTACRWSVEGVYSGTGLVSARAGLEWRPMDLLAIRTGYRTDTIKKNSAMAGFSTGLGLRFWGQEFDYAWVPYGDLGDTQYFSLLIRFGHDVEERRNLILYQKVHPHRQAHAEPNAVDLEYEQLLQILNYDSSFRSAQNPTER